MLPQPAFRWHKDDQESRRKFFIDRAYDMYYLFCMQQFFRPLSQEYSDSFSALTPVEFL